MVDETTVGIHPTSHGFGFVVFDSPSSLIDWGHANIRPVNNNRCLEKAAHLLSEHEPRVVVIEDENHASTRRGLRSQQLLTSIAEFASKAGADVVRVRRVDMRAAFAEMGARTNHEIAVLIASMHQELERHLPRRRRIWMSEDERISMFLAASFVRVHFRLRHG